MTSSRSEVLACHVCGAPGLLAIPSYQKLSRVTSDCKVWPAGGRLGLCRRCGCAQAILDAGWHDDAKAIYANYSIYHQSQGAEQNVFDPVSGKPLARSASLVQRLNAASFLPARGRMMDFGCGNGGLLRSFGAVFKDWTMAGLELCDDRRQEIESIERVEHLFTPPLAGVPGLFDLITFSHALEHIEFPLDCLVQIRDKLQPGGLVLIQVPDCAANPFMFLVADHASHFCLPVLQRLVQQAGYQVLVGANEWVAKELTVLGRKAAKPASHSWTPDGCMDAAELNASVAWLEQLSGHARTISNRKPFGIFGTSIAGTFLFGELGHAVDFFVDEDPNRPGKVWCGRPIYAPNQVPAGSHIFVGLAPLIAAKILERMHSLKLQARFYPPPPLPNASI
ncbi:MAG: class I SAM-dependent methyltransferase [Verrucomicrobiota bacterium]|jgi:SAM-dependent methyltransferase